MNRLTVQKQYAGGIPHAYWSPHKKEDIVQRLGAYEDAAGLPEAARMTHRRVNGIRLGYWSARNKESLVQLLGYYEDKEEEVKQ